MTKLGYQIPNFTYPGVGASELFDVVAAQAKEADVAGFDTLLVMDHFYQLPMIGPPTQFMMECYSAGMRERGIDLPALADAQRKAVTERFIVGDPDTVGEQLTADLQLGIDGFTLNAIINGHIPGRVTLLGQTAAKVVPVKQ